MFEKSWATILVREETSSFRYIRFKALIRGINGADFPMHSSSVYSLPALMNAYIIRYYGRSHYKIGDRTSHLSGEAVPETIASGTGAIACGVILKPITDFSPAQWKSPK